MRDYLGLEVCNEHYLEHVKEYLCQILFLNSQEISFKHNTHNLYNNTLVCQNNVRLHV